MNAAIFRDYLCKMTNKEQISSERKSDSVMWEFNFLKTSFIGFLSINRFSIWCHEAKMEKNTDKAATTRPWKIELLLEATLKNEELSAQILCSLSFNETICCWRLYEVSLESKSSVKQLIRKKFVEFCFFEECLKFTAFR